MSKLQKKPSALKRGHPTLQNMNFYKFFLLLWVIFALLDPDSESGSTDPIESGSNPDPQPWYHEIDLKFYNIYITRPNQRTLLVFKFCRSSDDFIMQKIYLLRFMPVCVGLIM